MFKEIRRKDRALETEEIIRILESGEYGVLGSIGSDGYPYTTPLNYAYINDSLYFHSALNGHKIENINYSEKVTFTVVGETKIIPEKFTTAYESVNVFGKATIVHGDEKKIALIELIKKYSPEYIEEGCKYINNALDKALVIKIAIERLTGKGNNIK